MAGDSTQIPKKGVTSWYKEPKSYWILSSMQVCVCQCNRLKFSWFGRVFSASEHASQTLCVCVMDSLTPVPTKLTGEVTGDNRLLHQLPEDDKDFGWNQIAFDVHILFMPLLKAFWELLHLQPLMQFLRVPHGGEELGSMHGVIAPVPHLAFPVTRQATQRNCDEELAGC